MAATLTLLHGPEFSGLAKKLVFGVVFTDDYPAGGPVIDLSSFVSGNTADLPISVVAERIGGYTADYIPGASIKLGKLKLFTTAATELTAAAYPADILALTDARLTVILPK